MKVLVIDDHPLVAQSLFAMIETLIPGAEIKSATNAKDGLAITSDWVPELALLDLGLPDASGLDTLTALIESVPTVAVVVVSGSHEKNDMQQALARGAVGYIPKSVSADIMRHALELVLSGGVYVPPEMVEVNTHRVGLETTPASPRGREQLYLTPRQHEVLNLLGQGMVNKVIAERLQCAETTVKAHITAIMRELNAKNRTEAVMTAQKLGLIQGD
ncbi:MAG: response regulator transcription factor [Agarilytica sp.]